MTESEENFNSALEKALQCLSHFGMSCELHTEQANKSNSYTSVTRRSASSTSKWFWKMPDISSTSSREGNSDFQNLSDRCVPLKSIVQDQIAEVSSMGLTAVSLADNRLEDIENTKRRGDSFQVVSFVSDVNKTDRPNTTPMVCAICTFAVLLFGLSAFLSLHSCL